MSFWISGPGKTFVSRVLSRMAITLGPGLPLDSSDLTRRRGPGQPSARMRASLFGLAPGGVYHAVSVTGDAVSSYLAFSPLPDRSPAVCFLWHFPSCRQDWVLPSALPCGARTFLPDMMSGRPSSSLLPNPDPRGSGGSPCMRGRFPSPFALFEIEPPLTV